MESFFTFERFMKFSYIEKPRDGWVLGKMLNWNAVW